MKERTALISKTDTDSEPYISQLARRVYNLERELFNHIELFKSINHHLGNMRMSLDHVAAVDSNLSAMNVELKVLAANFNTHKENTDERGRLNTRLIGYGFTALSVIMAVLAWIQHP